ncbi:MAG: enoyl-CoA hydratase/isomerase family protein [Microthrixaceae bacterium]
MTDQLRITDDDGVRLVTWTRPDALNAMSIEMWNGTRDALDSAVDDGIRCIVLTGEGRAFTVGQDLGEFGDPRHAEPDGGFRGLMRALTEVQVPLVAAANGMGVGFGLTVLPWCEIVLVSPEARFKAPFVGLGVTTEAAASVTLAEAMGPQAAAWHLLTGEWISAEDAVRHGLALRMVDGDALLPEALSVARRLADQPPIALRTTTRLLRERRRQSWLDAIDREYAEFAQLAGGEENIAAITAFFERS